MYLFSRIEVPSYLQHAQTPLLHHEVIGGCGVYKISVSWCTFVCFFLLMRRFISTFVAEFATFLRRYRRIMVERYVYS